MIVTGTGPHERTSALNCLVIFLALFYFQIICRDLEAYRYMNTYNLYLCVFRENPVLSPTEQILYWL